MPVYEQLTRAYNYPDQSYVWQESDVANRGVKGYFFSDAFSAYRRDAYEAVGGFDTPVAANEDTILVCRRDNEDCIVKYISDVELMNSRGEKPRQ